MASQQAILAIGYKGHRKIPQLTPLDFDVLVASWSVSITRGSPLRANVSSLQDITTYHKLPHMGFHFVPPSIRLISVAMDFSGQWVLMLTLLSPSISAIDLALEFSMSHGSDPFRSVSPKRRRTIHKVPRTHYCPTALCPTPNLFGAAFIACSQSELGTCTLVGWKACTSPFVTVCRCFFSLLPGLSKPILPGLTFNSKRGRKKNVMGSNFIALTPKPNINNTIRGNPGPFQSPFEHLPYQAEDKGKVVTDLLLSNFSKTLQIVKAVPLAYHITESGLTKITITTHFFTHKTWLILQQVHQK
ncbi:hypothetical protein D5086_020586 [Populus alba]|uniref:Uncharacterized protein n=1 Tax=Populus alba TaxID=43335 RepID=A0ACC4BLU0_POPAL